MTTTTNWEEEVVFILGDRKKIVDEMVGRARPEDVVLALDFYDEFKRQIMELLTKQRQELLDQVKSAVESCSLDLVACSDYAPPFRKDYTDKWKLLQKLSALRLSVKEKK